MADSKDDAVHRQLAADRAIVDESNKQFAERARGKPTPTQEENDRAKLGEHVDKKEDDGSGPEMHFVVTRQLSGEDKPAAATYATRQAMPQKKPE
jgi:hypothetical protein